MSDCAAHSPARDFTTEGAGSVTFRDGKSSVMRTRVAAAASSLFFLVPTTVSCAVPWVLTRWSTSYDWDAPGLYPPRALGVVLIALGAPTLVRAFVRFVTEGRGTPATPVPSGDLVVGGPYRRVRNPMYVAVLSLILGQTLLLLHPVLLLYFAVVWGMFLAAVHVLEEPSLRRSYGEQYEAYRAAVPAWLPRLRPWQGPASPLP